MAVFDGAESNSSNDAPAIDPGTKLLLELLEKQKTTYEQAQAACTPGVDLPKANIDNLDIWFSSNSAAVDTSHNGTVSHLEVDTALRDRCLSDEDRSTLNLLSNNFDFFAGIDRQSDTGDITAKGMSDFSTWVKADKAEMDALSVTSPLDRQSIQYLQDNFDSLDSRYRNNKLSYNEILHGTRSDYLTDETFPVIKNVEANYALFAEKPPSFRSPGSYIDAFFLGPLEDISGHSLAELTLNKNGSSRAADPAYVSGISAVETLRLSDKPEPGAITGSAP